MVKTRRWTRSKYAFAGIALLASPPALAQEVAQLIDVDIPVAVIEGDLLLSGGSMPGYNDGGLATIGLTDSRGFETELAGTIGGSYGPIAMIAGDYSPTYRLEFSTGGLPLNSTTYLKPPLVVTVDATVDLDVPDLTVRFDLRLNGAFFPTNSGSEARFLLRSAETGNEFPIALGSDGNVLVRVIPGIYDVIYSHVSGDLVPQNAHAVVLSNVDLRSPRRPVVVDVPAFQQVLVPRLNGGAFPTSAYESGVIGLHDSESGDSIRFGQTYLGSSARLVIPGRYDASYSRTLGGAAVPRNLFAIVATDIEIEPSPIPGKLAIDIVDVPMVEVTPVLTLNGGPFPTSDYERAGIHLTSPLGEDLQIARTNDASHGVVRLVPGTYDVFYRRILGGAVVPMNANARIARDVVIDTTGPLELDVESHQVGFDFTLDGEAFPENDYEFGRFHLVGESEGDRILVGNSKAPLAARRVVAGTYRVEYDFVLGGVIVPRNRHFMATDDVVVDGNIITAQDFVTHVVQAGFLMNGNAFPADPAQHGDFFLRDPRGGELRLGPSHAGPILSRKAIESAYAIDYEWRSGNQVPRNARHRLGYAAVPEPGFGIALAVGAGLLSIRARRPRHGRFARGAAA